MNSREFEKWYASSFEGDMFWSKKDDCYVPIKAHYMWLAWQEQQKKIDALEATLKKQNESIATLIDVITEAADV
jgi:hypothetical protein